MDSSKVLDRPRGSSDTAVAERPRLIVGRVATGAALIAMVLLVLRRLDEPILIDYEVYRWAHQTWVAGESITGGRVDTSAGVNLPWVYPPFAVLALAPFTALGYGAGAALLHAAGAAALWITILLVVDRTGGARSSSQRVVLSAVLAAAALLVLEPVRASIGLGQVNLVLMGLVAVDLLSRRTPWPRGLLLGLAIGIKLTPAVFLLMLVLRRDFRTAATAATTAALSVGIGFAVAPLDSVAYWWTVGPASAVADSPYAANQSLWAALLRLDLGVGLTLTVRVAVTALVLLAMVVIVRRADPPVALLAAAAVGLVLSPTSWTDHWVWAAPALALCVVGPNDQDGRWILRPLAWPGAGRLRTDAAALTPRRGRRRTPLDVRRARDRQLVPDRRAHRTADHSVAPPRPMKPQVTNLDAHRDPAGPRRRLDGAGPRGRRRSCSTWRCSGGTRPRHAGRRPVGFKHCHPDFSIRGARPRPPVSGSGTATRRPAVSATGTRHTGRRRAAGARSTARATTPPFRRARPQARPISWPAGPCAAPRGLEGPHYGTDASASQGRILPLLRAVLSAATDRRRPGRHMEMHDVIRRRRAELNLSQGDLAAKVGVDRRQIRRYEAGETQPTLSVAKAIARALGITIDELAGDETHRIDLTGDWWACWQSWKDGVEVINPHEVRMSQRGDTVEIVAVTRGTPLDGGGYMWQGEMRVWDNEVLMGWYVANEGAVRSKGTMYFQLHQHGVNAVGRWVGLSYDGPIITGWGALAKTENEVVALIGKLRNDEKAMTS